MTSDLMSWSVPFPATTVWRSTFVGGDITAWLPGVPVNVDGTFTLGPNLNRPTGTYTLAVARGSGQGSRALRERRR